MLTPGNLLHILIAQSRNACQNLCIMSELLTVALAAQESGVSKRTIQYQLLRGFLRGERLDGRWLIDRHDFDAWLANRRPQ